MRSAFLLFEERRILISVPLMKGIKCRAQRIEKKTLSTLCQLLTTRTVYEGPNHATATSKKSFLPFFVCLFIFFAIRISCCVRRTRTEPLICVGALANVSSDCKHLTPIRTISFQNLVIMWTQFLIEVSLYATLTLKICHDHNYLSISQPPFPLNCYLYA